jgi:carboxypeptidase family protein
MRWPYAKTTSRVLVTLLSVLTLMVLCPAWTRAQGVTTGSIAGTVTDQTGGIVPGAKIKLRDEGTNVIKETAANESGGFVFPNLPFGAYEVTVSAPGFHTAVHKGVVVESSRTTDLTVHMKVGDVVETVQIEGAAPVLEQTSNTISNTVRNEAIRNLPIGGRTILNFALLTPGSASVGGNGRNSAYNGMPGATINIMLDGINNNSNGFKSGGTSFFGTVPVRVDAIEEVTIATSGLGAEASGQGAMQIQFVTKRGTNEFHGGVFLQHQNSALNANSFSNKANGLRRAPFHLNEFGGRLGGPLPIPFWNLNKKLFFFVNYERGDVPGSATPTNTVLTQEAQQGVFRYLGTDGIERTRNVLQLAGGQIDPIIADQLRQINSFLSQGVVSSQDLIRNNFQFITPTKTINRYPTARLDYQITPNLSWTGTWNMFHRRISGNERWPGDPFPPNGQLSNTWYIASTAVNWTITPRTFNEVKYGLQHNTDLNNKDQNFDKLNINSRLMTLGLPLGVTTLVDPGLTIPRTNGTHNFYDNLKLLRGNHTMTIGGVFRHIGWYDANYSGGGVPTVNLGIATGDPVTSALTRSNTSLPSISDQDLNNARALYALLTGRVSGINAQRGVDRESKQFKDQTHVIRLDKQDVGSLYFQDAWRFRPNLTFNYGLRWEFSGDTHDGSDIYTSPTLEHLFGPSQSLFAPGALSGAQDPQIFQRSHTYGRDFSNPGPNFGFSWAPKFNGGFLAKIFGAEQKSVFRGSYGISYYDEGTNNFTSFASQSPGLLQSLSLSPGTDFPVGDLNLSDAFPPLVGSPASSSPPFRQADFTFRNISFSTMQPDLRTPYVQQWNFGIQRELGRNTVIEARYVGNKGTHLWRGYNLNEVNIFENGFLNEFKNAQRNLRINQAAGVASFQNRGLAGQSPLPIFEAAFGARGSQSALSLNQGFTNGGFIDLLNQGQAGRLAGQLAGNSNYLCRMLGSGFEPCARLGFNATGPYPINFFQVNPYAAGQNLRLLTDESNSNYHGLQVQYRQRLSKGLSLTANYTWSKAINDRYVDSDTNFVNYTTLREKRLDRRPSAFDLRHAFQAYWGYELPFGKGRAFASGNSVVDNIIGGWTFSGIVRWQSGRIFRLTSGRQTFNGTADSGVILNGITREELQKMVKVSSGGRLGNVLFLDPKLIGPDGRANPQFLSYPTSPGEFGQFIDLYGPSVFIPDLSLAKDIAITERVKFNLWATLLNAFNRPVFEASGGVTGVVSIDSTTFGQTGTTFGGGGARTIQIRAGLTF